MIEKRRQKKKKKTGCEKKTSYVLQLQWDWYKYCVEIRRQDTTNEDWEHQRVCNGELQSVEIIDKADLLVVTSWEYKCNKSYHPIQSIVTHH
jgi:hypothetical protein